MSNPTPTSNNPNLPKKPAPTPAAGSATSKPTVPGTAGAASPPKPTPTGGASVAKPSSGAAPARPAAPTAKPGAAAAPTKSAAPTAKTATATAPAKAAASSESVTPSKKPKPKERRSSGPRKIAQVLVDLGFLDEIQMESLYEESRTMDIPMERLAVERGLLTEEQLLQALAEQHNMKVVNLEEVKPTPTAISMVQETMANLYKMLPLNFEGDTLTVALADPNNLQALDDLRNLLGIAHVQPMLAPLKAIEDAITKAYAGKEDSITDLINSLAADDSLQPKHRETSIDLQDLDEIANAAPVRKLINMILLMAIRDRAADIHFEPFEEEYKIRMRCDGVLLEMVPPPRHLAMAISSRIKVMANLDIAERRLPQDGRIELNIGGNAVDMRVSVLPTMFGESVVIRVLDRSNVGLDLERIGLEPEMLRDFRQLIRKPNGITLVTGPTGAGKTTTLYSALSELNTVEEKIITTEDPVEYEIDGIIQCPINAEIDLTFASALRAILRQDPDKILVGEIRDLETATIAVQAALTGHMVFSTLHTNDAASTVTRLRDMGVEPYLITATVEGIMAQRLVRRICTNCKQSYQPSREQLMELNLRPEDVVGKNFYYGEGCNKCNNLGFKGRCGLYELLLMDDDLRDLVSKGASTDVLRQHVRKRGTRSLRDAGLNALFKGISTIDEVVRETVLEDEG